MTSTPTRPVDNVVITTKCLQDRNINILDGTTGENKGKLILNDFDIPTAIKWETSLFVYSANIIRVIKSWVLWVGHNQNES